MCQRQRPIPQSHNTQASPMRFTVPEAAAMKAEAVVRDCYDSDSEEEVVSDYDSEEDSGECQCFFGGMEGMEVEECDVPSFSALMSCQNVLDALVLDCMYLRRIHTDGRCYKAILMESAMLELAGLQEDEDEDEDEGIREVKDLIRTLKLHGGSYGVRQCGFCVANDRQRFHGVRSIEGLKDVPSRVS